MSEIEKIEKDGRKSNGGARPGSGRKALISKEALATVKAIISQHLAEVDENDLEKRERILVLMDKLYEEAKKGNIVALKEYMDRQMGKSKESLDVTSDGKPIIQIASEIATKYALAQNTSNNSKG